MDAEGGTVRTYATEIAQEIDHGRGPFFVAWTDTNRIRVMIGRAMLPDRLSAELSLDQFRRQLRPLLYEELVRLGWENRGSGFFWRSGATPPEPRTQSSCTGRGETVRVIGPARRSGATDGGVADLSPSAFESLLASLWREMGYSTSATKPSRDGGLMFSPASRARPLRSKQSTTRELRWGCASFASMQACC